MGAGANFLVYRDVGRKGVGRKGVGRKGVGRRGVGSYQSVTTSERELYTERVAHREKEDGCYHQ